MFFKDVIGQDAAKQRLIQEVQEGRIPHAQLFCGPAGVGKLPLAMAYARYICCPNRTETDACGTCPSCVKWNKLVHPDVHFVFPIVKSAKGKKEVCDDYIADWRRFVLNNPYFSLNHWLNEMGVENGQAIIYAKESDEITRKLSLKSSEGGYKVTIVWLPETVGRTARENNLPFGFGSPRNDIIHDTQPYATFQYPQNRRSEHSKRTATKIRRTTGGQPDHCASGERELHQGAGNHPPE